MQDNEETIEKQSHPAETVSSKAETLSAGASAAISEQKAAEVGERKLAAPMEGWGVQSYLNEFYPAMVVAFALRVMTIIEEEEAQAGSKTVVDIRKIREVLSREAVDLGEKALESLENCAIMDFMLRKAVPEILKDRPEDHLKVLDVGGGPTIYQHIPLMGIADSIIHSEFLNSNREEVLRWQEGKSDFDWSSFFETFQAYIKDHPHILDGTLDEIRKRFDTMAAEDTRTLEDDLRGKIQEVAPVDVFREDLGMGKDDRRHDLVNVSREGSVELITSNFCIESATASRETWRRGIENVTSKVPKDGFLLMTAIRNAEWYKVGDKKMDAVPVDADSLSAELASQGFEIRTISEVVGSEKEIVGYDGMVFVLAKRVKAA